jgi:O-antigen/teichoic acid export membrane protein
MKLSAVSAAERAGALRPTGSVRRRIAYAIADQALASVSNVGTAVLAARTLDRGRFGAFGLAMTVYLLVQGFSRAVVTEPLLSRDSRLGWDQIIQPARQAAGAATVIGLAAGAFLLVLAPILGGPAGHALACLAVVLPGVLLQDAWRYCFVAAGRPQSAFVNDALWCAVLVVIVASLATFGTFTLRTVLLSWGGAGTVAALFGCLQASALPSLRAAWRVIVRYWDLGGRYAAEFATSNGAAQGVVLVLGAVAGLIAVGAVRAAQVFFGPINILFGGMYMALVPEGARVAGDARRLRRQMVLASLGLMGVSVGWLIIGLALPAAWGRAVFGDSSRGAAAVMLPVGIGVIGGGAASGAIAGLRALAAAGASLRARLVGMPLMVILPVAGAFLGAREFAFGLAIATWCGAVVWWRAFDRALPEAKA